MPGDANAGRIVNRAQLAGVLGVTLPTVDGWIRSGCPVVAAGGRGREYKFDVAAVVDWRIKTAVDAAVSGLLDADGKTTKDEADRRRAVANAVTAEVEAEEALKSVVSRFDVETLLADFAQALRSGLANAGAKVASRTATMTNPGEIRDFCRDEINRAFDDAEADLKERWAGEPDEDEGDSGED